MCSAATKRKCSWWSCQLRSILRLNFLNLCHSQITGHIQCGVYHSGRIRSGRDRSQLLERGNKTSEYEDISRISLKYKPCGGSVANLDWFRCLCWLTLFAVEQFFFLWSGPSDTCRSATASYHDSLDKLSPPKSQPMVINLHEGCLFNWWEGCCELGEA